MVNFELEKRGGERKFLTKKKEIGSGSSQTLKVLHVNFRPRALSRFRTTFPRVFFEPPFASSPQKCVAYKNKRWRESGHLSTQSNLVFYPALLPSITQNHIQFFFPFSPYFPQKRKESTQKRQRNGESKESHRLAKEKLMFLNCV